MAQKEAERFRREILAVADKKATFPEKQSCSPPLFENTSCRDPIRYPRGAGCRARVVQEI